MSTSSLQFPCPTHLELFQRVRKSHLGPLSQRLLKQAHKASSSRLGEEQTAAQLRQALTWEGHEGDGIAAEMKQLHSALVMPSRDRSVSQVVSSEERTPFPSFPLHPVLTLNFSSMF